ncbi:MAG: helix-turn-helix transcriptional regulator [Planctomycetota bacterium]
MSELLDKLRTEVEARPESRRQISLASGVAESQLSRFASGDSGLGIDSIERLADYLGLEIVLRKKAKRRGRNP